MKKISIVIPVYNEKGTLKTLLEKIDKVVWPNGYISEVIIVDDGSNDGSKEILKTLDQKYIKVFKEKNTGKSSALREGFKYATGDYVVVQDADLEYDPNDLSKMLEKMIGKKYHVLYGSRTRSMPDVKSSGLKFFLGGMSLSLLANILYFQRLTDEATCYKMFSKDLLDKLPLKSMRFEFCPEVTALVSRYGLFINEMPISYFPRSINEGKKIRLNDFFEAVWTLVKYRFKFVKFNKKENMQKENIEEGEIRKHSFGEDERSFLDMVIFNLRFHKIMPHLPKNLELITDFGSGYKADSIQYLIDKGLAKKGLAYDLSISKNLSKDIECYEENFDIGINNLKENTSECILSLAILEHLNNPKQYLRDIHKSLKTGGVLLLTTPSPYSKPVLEFLSRNLRVIDRNEIDDHKHYFSKKELEDLAKEIGFSKYKVEHFELYMNNCLVAYK